MFLCSCTTRATCCLGEIQRSTEQQQCAVRRPAVPERSRLRHSHMLVSFCQSHLRRKVGCKVGGATPIAFKCSSFKLIHRAPHFPPKMRLAERNEHVAVT
ncbi:unnamed protein product [Acanthoscelides obtectus]|uniref:Uncharacterized protein n=1 Tax=Acanthoscelides obtectus TaxID=200917 RepID=A0A9P0JU39_ACAOB|nr:unnamed protein product [Acanthoscelides obtectus]CAK1637425.1 hypothetical protein AOBTE_LOCUS9967 [Acanthoscelides obtectus]